MLSITTAVEIGSGHPLAAAVVNCEKLHELSKEFFVSEFENLPGRGVRAKLTDGRTVIVGNRRFMQENAVETLVLQTYAARLAAQGETPVMVAVDNIPAGIISVADSIKKTSPEAILRLKKLGIRVVLLTGDKKLLPHISG